MDVKNCFGPHLLDLSITCKTVNLTLSFLSFFSLVLVLGPSEDFLLLFWAFLWVFLSCKMSTSILPGVRPRAKYWESGIRQTCPSQFQWSFSESYACDGIGVIWKGFHARWLSQQKEVVWAVPLDVDSRRTGEALPESTSLAQRRHTQKSPKSKARTLRTPTDSYSSVAKNQTTWLKMHKTWKRHFPKENRHVASGYRKRCLTLLILQLKIAVNLLLHIT